MILSRLTDQVDQPIPARAATPSAPPAIQTDDASTTFGDFRPFSAHQIIGFEAQIGPTPLRDRTFDLVDGDSAT